MTNVLKPGDRVRNIINPDLDYRNITRVEGGQLYLRVFSGEIGPFPVENYAKV